MNGSTVWVLLAAVLLAGCSRGAPCGADGEITRVRTMSGVSEGCLVQGDFGSHRQGLWTSQTHDGTPLSTGSYEQGRPHGLWTWYYADGRKKFEGHIDWGVRSGKWTYWHENGGRSMQGEMYAGRLVGRWRWWDRSGEELRVPQKGRVLAAASSGDRTTVQ